MLPSEIESFGWKRGSGGFANAVEPHVNILVRFYQSIFCFVVGTFHHNVSISPRRKV